MSLFISSINSGSNGNCYYIGNTDEGILVDAGISCRETEARIKRLGLSMQKIKAIFISHEHIDHIRGVEVLSRKHQIPVYITSDTLQNSGMIIEKSLVKTFTAYEPVVIGNISIAAFPKFHDASDPFSFVVECEGVKIGVLTDIGTVCDHVIKNFSVCHAAFLEANYDEDMLENGRYPYYLKKRISGEKGHLSNKQALELFKTHKSENLSHLFLSHLSKENNKPALVHELFLEHAGETNIIVASREKETLLYHIGLEKSEAIAVGQMSLF
jgi:phosphoribosyl 1,2-cyclic phosphodiesterase